MEQTGLSHNTTYATISLARLPDVTAEDFERAMIGEVLPATAYPLNRSDNVTGQELRKLRGDDDGAYQWVIAWNGVGNLDRIASGCEAIYGDAQAAVEQVGTRTGLTLASLEARWEA
ncbi:MAG: hypothetical protein R2844_10990 [Caldilineales bacterium]